MQTVSASSGTFSKESIHQSWPLCRLRHSIAAHGDHSMMSTPYCVELAVQVEVVLTWLESSEDPWLLNMQPMRHVTVYGAVQLYVM